MFAKENNHNHYYKAKLDIKMGKGNIILLLFGLNLFVNPGPLI